jgi:hypothetical protein
MGGKHNVALIEDKEGNISYQSTRRIDYLDVLSLHPQNAMITFTQCPTFVKIISFDTLGALEEFKSEVAPEKLYVTLISDKGKEVCISDLILSLLLSGWFLSTYYLF